MAATLHDVVVNLHNNKAIDLDTPLRVLAESAAGLAANSPIDARNGDMFFGSWLVFMTAGSDAPRLSEVASVASDVQTYTGTQTPPAGPPSFVAADQSLQLDKIGLIDLDQPLRSLLQPDGLAGTIRVEGGVSCFIHHRFCLLHVA